MKHKPTNRQKTNETHPLWSYHKKETSLTTPDCAYIDDHIINDNDESPLQPPPRETPPLSPKHTPTQRIKSYLTMGACVVLLVGLLGILGGALRVVAQDKHIPTTKTQWAQAVGGIFLAAGLPDLVSPLWGETLATQGETTQETTPADTVEPVTEADTSREPQTLDVTPIDMSLSSLGVYHWQGDEGCVPPAYTDLSTLLTPDKNQVLLVCSHPYATYHTGEDFVDVAGDSFAVDIPTGGGFPQKGVVALGEALTAMLCDKGIDAVMLSCAEGESHTQTYEATAKLVADYLAEHPQVGVVIDLCRSGELLPSGDVPRSVTTLGDIPTAQLQMVVSTGRGVGSMGDYTYAVTLRDLLFDQYPTVSRPIYLRRGEGIVSDPHVVCLSLALGTAGNTYEEAYALLPYVVEGIVEMVR